MRFEKTYYTTSAQKHNSKEELMAKAVLVQECLGSRKKFEVKVTSLR